ncbi:helix-turn-helix domain-containing protein [Stenotrophomonas rhizophila]|uniref:winged helix-turn-helix transcriptional regulator n=1 Tax=Stenotrophomonas rhizophila TaxID=216778 RepID=UPI002A6A74EF|nr:helix-turn-helix domain-containing protein [Stenotrophomonas rhizophila]MDY0956471.1 helix-turn-helix domain-containing protein [Stenotrophomonas rhizophila]
MHDDPNATCPVARALDLIGDRWSLLIVRDAFDGVHRFSDFQRSLGMSRSMLSQRLQALQASGVLVQQPAADGGRYQDYVLTAQGQALFPLVVALRQWGEAFLFAEDEPRSQLVALADGQPLAPLLPQDREGRVLASAATHVVKPATP